MVTLYSARRCPACLRARLALAAAGLQPGIDLEIREVRPEAAPPELLELSPAGALPVLVPGAEAGGGGGPGRAPVLVGSPAIARWAQGRQDPAHGQEGASVAEELLQEPLLHPGDAGSRAAARSLLLGWSPGREEWALLPWVRRLRRLDPAAFAAEPGLEPWRAWLAHLEDSATLAAVLAPPWVSRCAWRSPRRLYHLALRREWREARRAGEYRRSTRGRSLAEVGFIHLSQAHQVPATFARFYADLPAGAVVLLSLDPARLAAAGLAVRAEPAPESGELFPHLYGPLPAAAVLLAETVR